MNVAKLRELSGAMNAAEHAPHDAIEPALLAELGDALNYAADEIERLEKERATWESRWHATAEDAATASRSAAKDLANVDSALVDAVKLLRQREAEIERLTRKLDGYKVIEEIL